MIVASAACAQTDKVQRGPAPTWVTPSDLMPVPATASGSVFVRRQDVVVHLGDQGQAQYLGYRIKVLQSNALQVGNVSIAWNPRSGAPIVHDIKVYRDDQVIDVLKTSSFEILQREDQLEASMINGNLTAILRISDLRVGDELEVNITTPANDPTLGRKASGLLPVVASPPPGRYHLGLVWDEGHKPHLNITPDMTAAMVLGDHAIDFRLDNPAVMSPPKDAPARFMWQRMVEYTDFPNWAALSRQFAPLYVKAATLNPNSPILKEAERIAAANATPLARASAALKLVQQDVRYVYVGLNTGNLTPAAADETWQRRYGDCKGKTVLLLSLLKALGVEAEAVLVNSSGIDDGLDKRLPMPIYFDHVLVRAQIAGATYWLDGTLPAVATPSLDPVLPLKWVLPLTEAGNDLENLAWRIPTKPEEVNLYEIDARAGFDKPARIVSTKIVRGLDGLREQVQFSTVSADQLKDALRQRMIGNTWQTIDDVQWRFDQKAGASILTISGTGKVDWDDDGGGAKALALPGGGFNPPERRIRAGEQNADIPFYTKPSYSCHVTTVRIPTSTQPSQWSSKASFNTRIFGRNYYRGWELRDGAIRMVRGSRVEQPEIDAVTARRDNERVANFDNSMGWISFRPSGQKTSVGAGERVPATYDFDWTAEDAPCVPPSKSR